MTALFLEAEFLKIIDEAFKAGIIPI